MGAPSRRAAARAGRGPAAAPTPRSIERYLLGCVGNHAARRGRPVQAPIAITFPLFSDPGDQVLPVATGTTGDPWRTEAWRAEADQIHAIAAEQLLFDPEWYISSGDLLDRFNVWLASRGGHQWSDQTLAQRFGEHEIATKHGVNKVRVESAKVKLSAGPRHGLTQNSWVSGRVTAWGGVRWYDDRDRDREQVTQEQQSSPDP